MAAWTITIATVLQLMHQPPAVPILIPVMGWYDGYCCNDKDCHPLTKDAVTQTSEGYRFAVGQTEYTVPFGSDRIKPSQDGDYHACIGQTYEGGSAQNFARCFYIPLFF